ncbi:hypothetical protein ACJX0J_012172, partial [Zea mays]
IGVPEHEITATGIWDIQIQVSTKIETVWKIIIATSQNIREAYIHTNINANIFFNQDENKDIFISTTILLDSNTYRSIWIEVLWFINVSITYFGLFVDIGSTGWRWRWRWNRIEW